MKRASTPRDATSATTCSADSRSSGGSRSSRSSDGANGSNGSSDGSGVSDGAAGLEGSALGVEIGVGSSTAVPAQAASSTAEAARTAGRKVASGDKTWAAIGSAITAESNGLVVLTAKIADHESNQTRFVLVGRDSIPGRSGHDRTALVVYQRADEPGSLISILQEFAARRMDKFRYRYPRGESKAVSFERPGYVKVFCEIHDWMRAGILVVSNPFHARIDERGRAAVRRLEDQSLLDKLARTSKDSDVRAAILSTTSADAFCAGADVTEPAPSRPDRRRRARRHAAAHLGHRRRRAGPGTARPDRIGRRRLGTAEQQRVGVGVVGAEPHVEALAGQPEQPRAEQHVVDEERQRGQPHVHHAHGELRPGRPGAHAGRREEVVEDAAPGGPALQGPCRHRRCDRRWEFQARVSAVRVSISRIPIPLPARASRLF